MNVDNALVQIRRKLTAEQKRFRAELESASAKVKEASDRQAALLRERELGREVDAGVIVAASDTNQRAVTDWRAAADKATGAARLIAIFDEFASRRAEANKKARAIVKALIEKHPSLRELATTAVMPTMEDR